VRGVLYGVDAVDVPTFAIAIGTVLVITAAATLRPARNAAATEPLDMLRAQ
jgi:ABC-type lipoprotein release transport system permease subunit